MSRSEREAEIVAGLIAYHQEHGERPRVGTESAAGYIDTALSWGAIDRALRRAAKRGERELPGGISALCDHHGIGSARGRGRPRKCELEGKAFVDAVLAAAREIVGATGRRPTASSATVEIAGKRMRWDLIDSALRNGRYGQETKVGGLRQLLDLAQIGQPPRSIWS